MIKLGWLQWLVLAAACGGGSSRSYTVTFGPVTISPGTERTQCVVKRLGNSSQVHIGDIHNQLGDTSHHMIVYRVSDTVERPDPYDCRPFTDTLDPEKGSPLMVTQKHDDVLNLPAGVAYTLAPRQMLRIEMHYINATGSTKTLSSSTTMSEARSFDAEAGFLFIGDPDINLPPLSQRTLGPSFFRLPAEFADAKFFAITGHEHQFGTSVKVSRASNESESGTAVYDVPGWLWSEPATVFHNPPFSIPAGGGFNFTCSWNNTSTRTVRFGESAEDEMCFFWAYYYPNKGSRVCVTTRLFGGVSLCCPDAGPICAALPIIGR